MDLKLPVRTARELEWHDGSLLWVKTLNVFERDEAAEAAELWVANRIRYWRPGSEGYLLLQESLGAMSAEAQAAMLAEACLLDGSAAAEAAERWPGDEASMVDARQIFLRDTYERARQAALELASAVRLERCCAEAARRRERNLRGYRLVCETLCRAVRVRSDTRIKYFSSIDVVMELPDADRNYLWQVYEEMQLPADQVPTSAAVSLP